MTIHTDIHRNLHRSSISKTNSLKKVVFLLVLAPENLWPTIASTVRFSTEHGCQYDFVYQLSQTLRNVRWLSDTFPPLDAFRCITWVMHTACQQCSGLHTARCSLRLTQHVDSIHTFYVFRVKFNIILTHKPSYKKCFNKVFWTTLYTHFPFASSFPSQLHI